jgi:hypothetical protein
MPLAIFAMGNSCQLSLPVAHAVGWFNSLSDLDLVVDRGKWSNGGQLMSNSFDHTTNRSNRENLALEYILLGDLRDLLEEPPNRDTRRWLLAVLNALLDTLPSDMNDDGSEYLGEVLEEFPNWSRQVDVLHEQREELFDELYLFRNQIEQRRDLDEIAERLRQELRQWMTMLTAHQRHETRIIQMAYTMEVGAGD